MKLIINNDKLEIELSKAINSGSINYYNIECEFNEAWNGLIKEIIIKKQDEEEGIKRTVVNGIALIDCKINGLYQIGVKGYSIEYHLTTDTQINANKTYYINDNGVYIKVNNPVIADISTYYEAEKTLQISTGMKKIPVNLGAGEIETQEEETPSATELEVYIGQIQEVVNQASNLNITGQRVLDGVEITFTDKQGNETIEKVNDGETGQQGEAGYTPVKGIDYWNNADKQEMVEDTITEITPTLNNKVDKETGKGLSTNDYTTTEKIKLAGLSNYDDTELRGLIANKQNTTDNNLETNNKNIVPAINEVNTKSNTNTNDINTIESKIPNQATSSNKLADKDFVNSSINSVTAFYITKNAQGEQFNSKAELLATSTFYSGGEIRVPTRNDYCIVLEDESKDDSTTRYIYQNGQWEFQYIVNETALTSDQLKAINSGITDTLVTKLNGIEAGAEVNDVIDIQVDGVSVVNNKIANITGKENSSNKVTSISSSSTNTQYPSAKAVYDYIESLDIEEVSF